MHADNKTEEYWDDVAENISRREALNIIAGDDEPYYRYKRKCFLEWLDKIDFKNKTVLEVGSGPGGNLKYLSSKNCQEISGADVSSKMITISRTLLQGTGITVYKTNGIALPFDNARFDIVFTSTVLQHNTDDKLLRKLIDEICRVSAKEVFLFERIEKRIKGHESNTGRPVAYYSALFEENNFTLIRTEFLNIQVSYLVCGLIRKVFNKKNRKEGEPVSRTCFVLQKIALSITPFFDKIFRSKRDLGMLHFKKN